MRDPSQIRQCQCATRQHPKEYIFFLSKSHMPLAAKKVPIWHLALSTCLIAHRNKFFPSFQFNVRQESSHVPTKGNVCRTVTYAMVKMTVGMIPMNSVMYRYLPSANLPLRLEYPAQMLMCYISLRHSIYIRTVSS